MARVLAARKGKHALGYQSFHIARRKDTGEVVGMLLLKTDNSSQGFNPLVDAMTIPLVVMMNLGLIGLLRTGRNWMILHQLSPKLKPNELHIAYLAVSDGARRLRVGHKLLQYARAVAAKEDKQFMSLYVREKNVDAQAFFLSHGFSIDQAVSDEKVDKLLGQGSSFRMIVAV